MEKAVMWRVLRLEPEANKSTAAAFDDLWKNYGQKGYRRLSVRKGAAGELWALLFKGDQAKLTFEEPITTVCAIAKPGGGSGGQAGAKAIEKFARDWFVTGERTSNFRIAVAPESDEHAVLKTLEASRRLSYKEFTMSVAVAKVTGATQQALILKKCAPELKQLRAQEERQQRDRDAILREPCYRAVTSEGLHMPTDFVDPHAWMGETWSPDAPKHSMSFLQWMNSSEHLERTAVVYSDAGSGKTPALHATARSLAVRYQAQEPYYLCSGDINGLRAAFRKGLLRPGVPRVIEDYAPAGNPNGRRQKLEEYLVNLLNVRDGGAIDLPGGSQMQFPAGAPQLISTNRTLKAWVEKFQSFSLELQHAVAKRFVFFVLPNTPLVKPELRKRRQEDVTAAVAAGIEREKHFLRAVCGRDDAAVAESPSEAGMLTPTTASSVTPSRRAATRAGEGSASDGNDDDDGPVNAAAHSAPPAPKGGTGAPRKRPRSSADTGGTVEDASDFEPFEGGDAAPVTPPIPAAAPVAQGKRHRNDGSSSPDASTTASTPSNQSVSAAPPSSPGPANTQEKEAMCAPRQ